MASIFSTKDLNTDQCVPTLWIGKYPLILASASKTRSLLLTQAGIPHTIQIPSVDERQIEAHLNDQTPTDIALHLARKKALAISNFHPQNYVLGGDQTCTLNGQPIHKAQTTEALKTQLQILRGKTHTLTSAAAIAFNGTILGQCVQSAKLAMTEISDQFIDIYIDCIGDRVLTSVGGYQIENGGITLFRTIEGDTPTIMGLPLLELIAKLRQLHLLLQ